MSMAAPLLRMSLAIPALLSQVPSLMFPAQQLSRPACTWLGIQALNRPSQMVEIEMQAIKGAK